MSNNCLVTKLKGSVQNDNLPRFNQSLLDYLGRTDSYNSSSVDLMLMVDTSASDPVKVITAVDMHRNTASGELAREFTINPGFFNSIQATKEEIGTNPISNLFKIDNGIYDLCKLSIPIGINYAKVKTNLQSILTYGKVYALGLAIGQDNHDFPTDISSDIIEYISVICNYDGDQSFNLTLPDTAHFPALKVVNVAAANSNYAPTVKNISEGVEYIRACRFNGNISYLPSSLKGTSRQLFNTAKASGTLESFVEKARLSGRTSGYLLMEIVNYASATNITLNNVTLANIIASTPPPAVTIGTNNYYVLTWDANTISWGDTAPADALDICNMTTVYRYNKQS